MFDKPTFFRSFFPFFTTFSRNTRPFGLSGMHYAGGYIVLSHLQLSVIYAIIFFRIVEMKLFLNCRKEVNVYDHNPCIIERKYEQRR